MSRNIGRLKGKGWQLWDKCLLIGIRLVMSAVRGHAYGQGEI
jgi:hypothetical protein